MKYVKLTQSVAEEKLEAWGSVDLENCAASAASAPQSPANTALLTTEEGTLLSHTVASLEHPSYLRVQPPVPDLVQLPKSSTPRKRLLQSKRQPLLTPGGRLTLDLTFRPSRPPFLAETGGQTRSGLVTPTTSTRVTVTRYVKAFSSFCELVGRLLWPSLTWGSVVVWVGLDQGVGAMVGLLLDMSVVYTVIWVLLELCTVFTVKKKEVNND